jgi:hypothetical protein
MIKFQNMIGTNCVIWIFKNIGENEEHAGEKCSTVDAGDALIYSNMFDESLTILV